MNSGNLIPVTQTITASEGLNTIKVYCDDVGQNTGESEIITFNVDTTAPGQVVGLQVETVIKETSLDLSWDTSQDSDFSYYKIYRSSAGFSDVSSMSPITMFREGLSWPVANQIQIMSMA